MVVTCPWLGGDPDTPGAVPLGLWAVPEKGCRPTFYASGRPPAAQTALLAWKRVQAEQSSECWQADVTTGASPTDPRWRSSTSSDDHSRLAVASPARRITRGPDVAAIFFHAFAQWGTPAAVLTDNGASSPPNNGALAAPPWRSRSANTLYAHVWNLGKSPAYRVRVESAGATASLGITRTAAHLFGAPWMDVAYQFTVYPD